MVQSIKIAQIVDIVTDCIPVVGTIKGAGYLLYQQIHKVDRAANPVKNNWTADIKIIVLSKEKSSILFAMIPFVNILSFFAPLSDAIVKAISEKENRGSKYLRPAATGGSSWEKHSYEIAKLYLARNSNHSEEKLSKPLLHIVGFRNPSPIFNLIFNSREDWSPETIINVLRSTSDINIVRTIFNRYPSLLNSRQIAEVIKSQIFLHNGIKSTQEMIRITQRHQVLEHDDIMDVFSYVLDRESICDTRPLDFLLSTYKKEIYGDIDKNYSKEKLSEHLIKTAQKKNFILFENTFNLEKNWPTETILHILEHTPNIDVVDCIFDRLSFTSKEIAELIKSRLSQRSVEHNAILEQFIALIKNRQLLDSAEVIDVATYAENKYDYQFHNFLLRTYPKEIGSHIAQQAEGS